MPRHADEQPAVVTEVGRPPLLRVRHQGLQVLDHGVEVEALELLGVVERLAHRIGQGGVLVENLNVQLVRPPVAVPVSVGPARERALALTFHVPPIVFRFFRFPQTKPRSEAPFNRGSSRLRNIQAVFSWICRRCVASQLSVGRWLRQQFRNLGAPSAPRPHGP